MTTRTDALAARGATTEGEPMTTDIWADVQDDEAGQRITVFAIGEPGCYVANGHIDFEPFITAVVESGFCTPEEEEWDDPRHTWMVTEQGEAEWELYYHEVLPGTRDAYPVTLIPVKGYWKEQPR